MESEKMPSQKKKVESLRPEEITRMLLRECEVQSGRVTQLEEALTEEDYNRVARLVDSFDQSLNQCLESEDAHTLKLLVTRTNPRTAGKQ